MSSKTSTWRRSAAITLLLALAIPLLAGCSGSSGSTTASTAPAATEAPTPATAPAATEAPRPTEAQAATIAPAATEASAAPKGGRLKLLYWQAITTLNPHQASGTKDFDGAALILEPFARHNEKNELIPFLAAEIPTIENGEVAKDSSSVTWKLRPGLKWSDGSDFTPEDVIFTWNYCKEEATACTTKAAFDPIQNIEALDATTVKITWKKPTANPYISFVGSNGMVLQKAQFGNCIGAKTLTDAACQAANAAPIGTNAWKLKEFKPGDTVLYERNPNYRNADKVFFDEVEIKGGGDATLAARAVCETGEVDFAWNLQIQKTVLEPILKAGKCYAVAGGSFGVERLVVNFSNPDAALGDKRAEPDQPHPILSDPKVRQAINLALDRKAMADQIYGAGGEATCNILVVPPALNSPNTKCDRDLEAAKKLLDEAGWKVSADGIREKDGKKLILSFQTSINPLRQGVQAIVKANLAEAGITVNLKTVDGGVFFSGDQGNPDTLNKFYADLQMYTNGPNDPDPQNYFESWQCKNANSAKNQWNGNNDGRYCSKEYDATFAQLQAELDLAKRAELAIKLNDILVADNALIPLINRFTPNGVGNDLKGPTFNTFDSGLWNIQDWHK